MRIGRMRMVRIIGIKKKERKNDHSKNGLNLNAGFLPQERREKF